MKMRQSIVDDEFWTPKSLYEDLCKHYNFYPNLDAAANADNTKCEHFLTNALYEEWIIHQPTQTRVWCNPPHSQTAMFVMRAGWQYAKYENLEIMMIVPANFMSTDVWHNYVEGMREYHAIKGRPRFLRHGVPSKFPSRNAYVVILWRKK